jgi:hypothetical protein
LETAWSRDVDALFLLIGMTFFFLTMLLVERAFPKVKS